MEGLKKKVGWFHKKHTKLIVFLAFAVVFGFLIYTSLFDPSFSGKIISNEFLKGGENVKKIDFSADLNKVPFLEIDGEFEKLEISGGSDSYFYVGNQKFYLGDLGTNFISLVDYNGEVSFDENKILSLNGRSSEVVVNGISVSSDGTTTKINIKEEFDYKSLEIENGVEIKKLSQNSTSGTIRTNNGKNLFTLNNEEISIRGFYGNIKVENKKFKLDGKVESAEIKGDSKISVSL